MLLNCMRESLMFWMTALIIAFAFTLIVGGLFTVAVVGWRGYKIYNKRFGKQNEDDEEEENKQERQQRAGTSPPQSAPPSGEAAFKEAFGDKKEEEKEKEAGAQDLGGVNVEGGQAEEARLLNDYSPSRTDESQSQLLDPQGADFEGGSFRGSEDLLDPRIDSRSETDLRRRSGAKTRLISYSPDSADSSSLDNSSSQSLKSRKRANKDGVVIIDFESQKSSKRSCSSASDIEKNGKKRKSPYIRRNLSQEKGDSCQYY